MHSPVSAGPRVTTAAFFPPLLRKRAIKKVKCSCGCVGKEKCKDSNPAATLLELFTVVSGEKKNEGEKIKLQFCVLMFQWCVRHSSELKPRASVYY